MKILRIIKSDGVIILLPLKELLNSDSNMEYYFNIWGLNESNIISMEIKFFMEKMVLIL